MLGHERPFTTPRRVAVILNKAAGALVGHGGADGDLGALFAQHGFDPVFIAHETGTLPERVRQAADMDVWAVIAAGGDGTVACTAQALAGTGQRLGILPFGTMNLLAKDLNLPIGDTPAAVRLLAAGQDRSVDVADVNGRVFLCASMMGLPARMARHREGSRGASVPGLWARMARAGLRAIAKDAPMRLRMRVDGEMLRLRASSLTITANAVDEACGRPFGRPHLDRGELAIYMVSKLTLGRALRLMILMALGLRWRDDGALQERRTQSLDIVTGRSRMRVMNDGEVLMLAPPLRYRIRTGALTVIAPAA